MHTSKTIRILSTLNDKEFRQFNKYIRAPLFTQSEDVIRLYTHIRRYYPAFDSPKLERKTIFIRLFPNRVFDTARFSNLLQKLNKILENYLIYLKYQQNDFLKKKLLTQIYGERNLNVIFKKNTNELLTELEEQPYRDSQYFYDSYFLQQGYYLNANTVKQKGDTKYLENAIQNLQSFHNIERLRLGLDLKNRARIFGESFQFDISSFSISSENLIFNLYKQLIYLLETNETIHFEQSKSLFLSNIRLINPKDGAVFIQVLANHAIQKMAIEEKKYAKAAFEIYDIGIQSKLLLTNNAIPVGIFLNIVTIAAKLKKFDYTKSFIKKHKSLIKASIQTEICLFAESFVCFHQKNYNQSISILQSIRFSDALLKLNAKILLVRCHYHLFEQNPTYSNVVYSSCEALEVNLKRTTNLSDSKKEAFSNFTRLLKKITQYKMNYNSTQKAKLNLLDSLKNNKSIVARGWIEEIIQRL